MLKETHLSPHFTLKEMQHSATATLHGIDNTIPCECVPRLKRICCEILEPVRAHFGAPIVIASGYRSPKLNQKVGGVQHSQHTTGEAVDLVIHTATPMYGVWQWMKTHVPYDQLIYEIRPYSGDVWIHVSYRLSGNRHEAFISQLSKSKTQRQKSII